MRLELTSWEPRSPVVDTGEPQIDTTGPAYYGTTFAPPSPKTQDSTARSDMLSSGDGSFIAEFLDAFPEERASESPQRRGPTPAPAAPTKPPPPGIPAGRARRALLL